MRGQAAHEKEVPGFQEHSALLALKPGKSPSALWSEVQRKKPQQAAGHRSCTKLQHPSISPCSQTPEVAVAGNKHLLLQVQTTALLTPGLDTHQRRRPVQWTCPTSSGPDPLSPRIIPKLLNSLKPKRFWKDVMVYAIEWVTKLKGRER